MLRVVFMGTPDFAVPTLAQILAAGHDVGAVYTRPPQLAGRGLALRKSPVHLAADAANIRVLTPTSLKLEPVQAELSGLRADAVVVVAYGLILPPAVLECAPGGCLNLHGSALPRWRGAAPIQRAIMAGDRSTAATVMRMDEGLDTGPVCLTQPIAIGPDMTAGELHDQMAIEGGRLMVRALAELEQGRLACTPQPQAGVTYAAKIDKAETRIDFNRPAADVHNHIRALSPFPAAWLEAGPQGRRERIKVLRAMRADAGGIPGTVLDPALTIACASGAVRLTALQRQGKRPMPAEELLRGFELAVGTRL